MCKTFNKTNKNNPNVAKNNIIKLKSKTATIIKTDKQNLCTEYGNAAITEPTDY